PVKDNRIRLIRLRPGEWSDDLKCDLFSVSLDEQPQYQALSYVWDSQKITRLIWLNGQRQRVTINPESALRHIREHYNSLVLWVDAVFINQEDFNERTHQVGLM
ncbi:hypothetical protein P154DRAFT_394118, partial [Amniculicola lignicola CBS 123094]